MEYCQPQQEQSGYSTNQYLQSLKTNCSDRRRLIAPASLALALIFVISSMCVNWMVTSNEASKHLECTLFSQTYDVSTNEGGYSITDKYSKICKNVDVRSQDDGLISFCNKVLPAASAIITAMVFLVASIAVMVVLAVTTSSASANEHFNRISKRIPIITSLISVILLIIGWSLWLSIIKEKYFTKVAVDLQFSSGPFFAAVATVLTMFAAVCAYLFPMIAAGQPKKVEMMHYQSYPANGTTLQVPQAPEVQQKV